MASKGPFPRTRNHINQPGGRKVPFKLSFMSYRELKKIRRNSGSGLIYETLISEDRKTKTFKHGYSHSFVGADNVSGTTTMKVERNIGAGVRVSVYTVKKGRIYEQSIELGKSEVEMLKEFIAMVEPELRDYNGTFEPTQLIDLTK